MDVISKIMHYLLLGAEHSRCGKSFRVWMVASPQLEKEANRRISYGKRKRSFCFVENVSGQLLSQCVSLPLLFR